MWTDRVRLLSDVSAAAWIAERLDSSWRTIAGVVPTGFEAYARILHPVQAGDGPPSTWRRVAEATGRTLHPTAQWHALIDADSPYDRDSALWQEGQPDIGNLAPESLLELCDVLARHTTTPEHCYFAMWEGWGYLHGARVLFTYEGVLPSSPVLTPDELATPRLQLPGRAYHLFQGPAAAMGDLVRHDGAEWPTQSPALFWPADRTWCVATEIDFDSTLVGASAVAVADLLAVPGLETLPIGLDASLQADADDVNRT